MNRALINLLKTMPIYPNLEYEITRTGLTKRAISNALHISIKTLEKVLCGKSDFDWDLALKMQSLIRSFSAAHKIQSLSLEYLFFSPRKGHMSLGALSVAEQIMELLHRGELDHKDTRLNIAFRHFSEVDRECGQIIIRTLLNFAEQQAPPEIDGADDAVIDPRLPVIGEVVELACGFGEDLNKGDHVTVISTGVTGKICVSHPKRTYVFTLYPPEYRRFAGKEAHSA